MAFLYDREGNVVGMIEQGEVFTRENLEATAEATIRGCLTGFTYRLEQLEKRLPDLIHRALNEHDLGCAMQAKSREG